MTLSSTNANSEENSRPLAEPGINIYAPLPYSIDFRPIGACNLRCSFCFGPSHNQPAMSTTDALKVIDFMAEHGTKAVVVTGGEPTLRKDLHILLKQMKDLSLKVILSTNGMFLFKKMDEILPYLDWIALPIDGSTREDNARMRIGGPNHLDMMLDLIPTIRKKYPSLKIKLGTVVTRLNKDSVPGVLEILRPYCLPDIWKIYQVSFSNYARDNRESLEITDADFEAVIARATYTANSLHIPLVVYRNAERNGKYLFIDPSGDAVVIQADDELVIGNILSDPAGVLRTWSNFVDEEHLIRNIEVTYPE